MTKEEIRKMRLEGSWMDNERKAWDDDSLTSLTKMYFGGYDLTEIAFALKRSEMAVSQKINLMELNHCTKKSRMRKEKNNGCKCNECSLRDFCEDYQHKVLCEREYRLTHSAEKC